MAVGKESSHTRFSLPFAYFSSTFRLHFFYVSPTFDLHFIYIWPTFVLVFFYFSFTFLLLLFYFWPTFLLHFTHMGYLQVIYWPFTDLILTLLFSYSVPILRPLRFYCGMGCWFMLSLLRPATGLSWRVNNYRLIFVVSRPRLRLKTVYSDREPELSVCLCVRFEIKRNERLCSVRVLVLSSSRITNSHVQPLRMTHLQQRVS